MAPLPAPIERRLPLVALVTDPTSALGRATALRLAQESARLVLLGHASERDEMEALGRECACVGAPAVDIHPMEGTLHDASIVHRLARVSLSRQGGVDVIVSLPPGGGGLAATGEGQGQPAEGGHGGGGGGGGLLHHLLPHGRRREAPPTDRVAWLRRIAGELLPEMTSADRAAGGVLQQAEGQASKHYVITVLEAQAAEGHLIHAWAKEAAQAAGPAASVQTITLPPLDGPQPLLPAAVAELVLLPWRRELAPGRAHEVTVTIPAEQQSVPASSGPRAACWLQLSSPKPLAPPPAGSAEAAPEGPVAGREFEAAAEGLLASCYLGPPSSGQAALLGATAASRQLSGGVTAVLATTPDDELKSPELGTDPGAGATRRADPSRAVWLEAPSVLGSCGGIEEATGRRKAPGLLTRPAGPRELGLAKQGRSGAVLAPADPHNLEPSMSPDQYTDQPVRNPLLMVHAFAPFNGETPHTVLSKDFLTPADLFYVRNHLPVPSCHSPQDYRLSVSGAGLGGRTLELSLDDLQGGAAGPIVRRQATLQCAGNRRNEMAALKLVEGRAPWNHGGIGNALWTGVNLADVLSAAGLDVPAAYKAGHGGGSGGKGHPKHVILRGLDWHCETKMHYNISIPLDKALDPRGGVMLAWGMNRQPLPADHGFPLRAIVPGFVGARSVKWLQSVELSEGEAESPWQKVDYKLMPQAYHKIGEWMPHADTMPAIQGMPVQSAILEPEPRAEPGTVVPAGTEAVFIRGYAWSGNGVPIIRVDVSADGGASWVLADLVEGPGTAEPSNAGEDDGDGMAWAWVKFEVPLEVPEPLRLQGGKWRVAVKAINRNSDSQPGSVASVWNFRGLANNAWHTVPLYVEPPAASA